ncbi:uncharacterized protein LOC116298899 [Actinia tenebrosa]|uniref:Uncharacterized protein LOC116298899 n=1 Tax=Actinia tenebrosa TaxID=6105 RepID=A0A6P8IDA7_ACTTE|nr:uncharacterized protein LOC116298899 [Actinia tenebrosa]
MNASCILIFLVLVAITANLTAARSNKKSKTEKAVDDAIKHRVKTKKIDALKQEDGVDNYWTMCKPKYDNPLGVCLAGYHLTQNPKDDNKYTWAKEVDGIWDGTHTFRCPDRPYYKVRYFCSKTFTKSYWQGTAPWCGSENDQVNGCQNAGYQGLRIWTSDYGDGNYCALAGTKVLCAKV